MDVKFINTTSNKLNSLSIVNGQLIALSDKPGFSYDLNGTRQSITLSDNYTSSAGTAASGVAASSYALATAYRDLIRDADEVYNCQVVDNVLKDVRDTSFIYNPRIKRVDFQLVGNSAVTLTDWTKVAKIPENLPIKQDNDAWCGTVMTVDGCIGVCFISPSHNGYLSVVGVAESAIGSQIKCFGSYYTK